MRLLPVLIALAAAPAAAQDIEMGREHFQMRCAACHGGAAKGAGPMAPLLTVVPTDLTQIAARHGGDFPTDWVVRRIDGTIDVAAHGGAMPVFGMILKGPSASIVASDGTEVVAPEVIVDITAWLETIQE